MQAAPPHERNASPRLFRAHRCCPLRNTTSQHFCYRVPVATGSVTVSFQCLSRRNLRTEVKCMFPSVVLNSVYFFP